MPPGSLGQLFFFITLGRGSFLFFRIAHHEIDCRGPEKVTAKRRFFARSFSTNTTSIRAGFVLLYAAHRNAEYDHVSAPLIAHHTARGRDHRETHVSLHLLVCKYVSLYSYAEKRSFEPYVLVWGVCMTSRSN